MRLHSEGFLAVMMARLLHELSTAFAVALVGPRGRRAHPVLAGLVIVVIGVLVGVLTTAFLPSRLTTTTEGLAAAIAATIVLTSIAMALLGSFIRSREGSPSPIASFWGGALFGAAIAVTRLGMTA